MKKNLDTTLYFDVVNQEGKISLQGDVGILEINQKHFEGLVVNGATASVDVTGYEQSKNGKRIFTHLELEMELEKDGQILGNIDLTEDFEDEATEDSNLGKLILSENK